MTSGWLDQEDSPYIGMVTVEIEVPVVYDPCSPDIVIGDWNDTYTYKIGSDAIVIDLDTITNNDCNYVLSLQDSLTGEVMDTGLLFSLT